MARPVPQKLQAAAGVLAVTGAVDAFVSMSIASFVLSVVGGVVGALLGVAGCPCGGLFPLCGLWAAVLLPIGMIQVVCAAMIFVNPDASGVFARVGNLLQFGAAPFGGLAGVIGGVVVRNLLADPDVAAFLADPDALG